MLEQPINIIKPFGIELQLFKKLLKKRRKRSNLTLKLLKKN
jgi:hypothetical protein